MKERTGKGNGSAGRDIPRAGEYLASRANEGKDAASSVEISGNFLEDISCHLEGIYKVFKKLPGNHPGLRAFLPALSRRVAYTFFIYHKT